MAPRDHDPVLITGCSTGIGRATASALLDAGHTVWATARRPDTLSDLKALGAHVTALDVTDEESMHAAVAEVEAAHGAVGTLVNNAGYGEYGAVEEVDLDKVRAMFETNVFGLAADVPARAPGHARAGPRAHRQRQLDGRPDDVPARRVLPRDQVRRRGPHRRPARRGHALRRRVVVVEPGVTRSAFEETIGGSHGLAAHDDSPYAAMRAAVTAINTDAYGNRGWRRRRTSVAKVDRQGGGGRTRPAPATC